MNILVNGYPKHGVHAALKTVELLGLPVQCAISQEGARLDHLKAHFTLNGITYVAELNDIKHVFIVRNPRNALISWFRQGNLPLQTGKLIGQIKSFKSEGVSYPDTYNDYLPWLNDPQTLVVRFEGLVSDKGKTIERIADYLGVKYFDDAFESLPGGTITWMGEYSDWQKCWNDDIEQAWIECGGLELEKALGYAG